MLEAKANWLGKKNLKPGLQRDDAPAPGRIRWLRAEWVAGLAPFQLPSGASTSGYPDGNIDDLAAQVGNVLANVFGTELVCRMVEILRQLHADAVRVWLRARVA